MKTFPFELLQFGKVKLRWCYLVKYIAGLSTCWSCNHRSGYPLENYSVKVTPFLENISRYEEYKTRVNEMFPVKKFRFILRISGQEQWPIVQVGWCGGEVELGHDNHLPSTQVRSCSCLAVASVATSGGRPSFCFISPDQWERRVGAGGWAGPIRGPAAVSGYDIWRNYRLVITHSARPAPAHCLIRDQAPVTTQSAAT